MREFPIALKKRWLSPIAATTLSDSGARTRRAADPTWLSSAAAIGLTLALAVGPLVPPAAAQQATPSPTPRQVVIQLSTPQTIATGLPTSQSISSSIKTPTPAPITVGSCGDPNRLFGTIKGKCAFDPKAQDALQAWAIQTALQLYQLPPTDGPRLMGSARSTLRALVLSRLLTASKKPVSQQTPEEQTALAALSGYVQQFKINVAQDALTEYARWQANPFCYQPPDAALAAGSWPCVSTAPTPQQEMFQPTPPTYDQFEAWGNAIELAKLGQPTDQVMADLGLDIKTAASLAGSEPPGIALGAIAGYNMPQSWFRISAPFRYRRLLDLARSQQASGATGQGAEESAVADAQQSASDASSAAAAEAGGGEATTDAVAAGADTTIASAEAAEATTSEAVSTFAVAGTAGATVVASTVSIVLICVAAIVEGSIDLATRLALPDKLNGALSNAQKAPDLAGADNATAQLIYAQMTEPDPTTIDPGPGPNIETDLHIHPDDAFFPDRIYYVALDGTEHTARAPRDGWWVDTDASGTQRLTLRIEFRDAANTAWTATRVGPGVLLARSVDANPSNQVATTTFQYVDWNPANWTPTNHSQFVAGRARFVSDATEPWSISATSAQVGGNTIAHFNSATGQWTSVDGGAIKVAVGPNGQPWVVNQQGAIFRRTRGATGYVDGSWQAVPGAASDLAIGADGSVWAIGTAADVADVGGSHIYHYNPTPANQATNAWEVVDGGAIAVAVGPDGQPWVVNKQGSIFNRTKGNGVPVLISFNGSTLMASPSGTYVDGQWQVVPGQLSAIAAGVDGSIWGIGVQHSDSGGNQIYHYNPNVSSSWDVVDGGAVAVAVGPNGQPWVVNQQGALYSRSRGQTSYVDGAWNLAAPTGSATNIGVGGPVI